MKCVFNCWLSLVICMICQLSRHDNEWFSFCPRDRKYSNGQRSNRATGAGTIKSRKMGLIGMKKTLVFYTGRAPKGERTSWVIHEYRPLLQELDGTNPGQGDFILCRLFKKSDELKEDENDDGCNIDEMETGVLSPYPTNISQEDARSGPAFVQASPGSVEQPLEQHKTSKNLMVKTSDSLTSEATKPTIPDYSHSHIHGNIRDKSYGNEEIAHEVNSRIAATIPPDAPCETSFPATEVVEYNHDDFLKLQMHSNQGMAGMEALFTTDIGDGQIGFHFQDIDGRDPISNFLNSVVNQDDPLHLKVDSHGAPLNEKEMREDADLMRWKKPPIYKSGSCSGSDVQVPHLQHDVGRIGCKTSHCNELELSAKPVKNSAYTDNEDLFSDAALERFCNLSNVDNEFFDQNSLVKAEDDNYIVGSKIQLRSNGRRTEPQPTNRVHQGTASRRIHLATDAEGKVPKAVEKETDLTASEGSCLSIESEERGGLDQSYFTSASHEDLTSIDELNDNPAPTHERSPSINDGQAEADETGIKIRPRFCNIHLVPTNCDKQGAASKRLRWQMLSSESSDAEDDNSKPLVADISNLFEEIGQNWCADISDIQPKLMSRSMGFRWRSALYICMILLFMVAFSFMIFKLEMQFIL
ncbi:NAC domain-containing protein 14-like isoform X2 [Silene latifolia]|uniref:NAC domain-containing protein 14-like isoform X2 n=1 Tax=Silene latifolia TaxID=37657 RepID=UPI003D77D92F